ncbi:hypothetical protein [Roseateles sp. DAIF2]|nr:hypothetical protein [Roseateles sp. DAIF2]
MLSYLLFLILAAAAAWRLWTAWHRLWRSIPSSNRDFGLEWR